MDCRDASRFSALAIDGEIDEKDAELLHEHLAACRFCCQRFEAEQQVQNALKQRLQTAVQTSSNAPSGLASRVKAAGRAEAKTTPLSTMFGVPAFAGFALVVVSVLVPNHAEKTDQSRVVGAELTERAVLRHRSNLPAEFSSTNYDAPNLERVLSQHLPFRVQIPAEDKHSRLVGARLSHIGKNDVAYLMYDHLGSRLSVFAFPRGRGINAVRGHRLVPQSDRNGRPIYVGRQKNHNVLSWSDEHADFAVVSDLDVREMIQWSLRARDFDHSRRRNLPPPRSLPRSGNQVRTVSHRR